MDPKGIEIAIWKQLSTVMDPELNIDLVSLGLIYEVDVVLEKDEYTVNILLTLTTPGCPLASTFDPMIRSALVGIPQLDVDSQVNIELTFDPPWTPDMMSEEAKAELDILL